MANNITLNTYNNPIYAQRFFQRTRNLRTSAERTFIEKIRMNCPQKAPLLDAGCGIGRDLLRFRQAGLNIIGVDGAQELLKTGHEQLGIPKEWLFHSDLRQTSFLSNNFWGIWSKAVLGHFAFPDNLMVLGELARICTPSAIIFLRVREGDREGIEERDGFPRFYKYYGAKEIRELMLKAGFERLTTRLSKDEGGFDYNWLNVWGLRKSLKTTTISRV